MNHYEETRRTGKCERVSETILGGIVSEDSNLVLSRQAARIEARFAVGGALAKAIAELAFATGARR